LILPAILGLVWLLLGGAAAGAVSRSLKTVVSDETFLTAERGFYAPAIQAFLEAQHAPLAAYQEQGRSAAEIIGLVSQQRDYGLNPKALLTTLFLETQLDLPSAGNFEAYAGTMALAHWTAWRDFGQGARSVRLKDGRSLELDGTALNGATYALARYFAPASASEAELAQTLQAWGAAYHTLFGQEARAASVVTTQATVAPFLGKVFNQPTNDFYAVTSFFDHDAPGGADPDDDLLRFDGRRLAGTLSDCADGLSCYSGHNAIDYKLGVGTPVLAAADGTVVSRNDAEGGLILDHDNGYRTLYWHLDVIQVSVGQDVVRGQQVAQSGSKGVATSPHLHFGLRLTDGSKDVDPYGWWGSSTDPWGSSQWLWDGDHLVDNREEQAQLLYTKDWIRDGSGYNGESWYTLSTDQASQSSNSAIWGTYIYGASFYKVSAYWPQNSENTTGAKYKIYHAGGLLSEVTVNQQANGNDWIELGSFNFSQGPAAVILTDLTNDAGRRVYFDAVRWESGDTTPPATTVTFAGEAGTANWFRSSVVATLTADDGDGTGVKFILYSVDGGTWDSYTGAVLTLPEIGGEGQHTIAYQAVDNVNNPEAKQDTSFGIDLAPPTGSLSINNGAESTDVVQVTLGVAADDALSGVSQMRFRDAGGNWTAWQTYTPQSSIPWSLTRLPGQQSYTVEAQFRDVAGNESELFQDSIILLNNTVSGRVAQINGQPMAGVTVAISGQSSVTSGGTGYQATGLPSGSYTLTPALDSYSFSPANRAVTLPPDAPGQNFIIYAPAVSTTLISGTSGALTYRDTQNLATELTAPANGVSLTTTLELRPLLTANAGRGFSFAGHAFELVAVRNGTALPDFSFNTPVTITIHYSDADILTVTDEALLTLRNWTGSGWDDATQTCTPPSTTVRNISQHVIQVAVCRVGSFSLFGPTNSYYMPLLFRQQ
jgi:murein DD-endopeptidase MepM/ murein hydrolase activator NlpD